MSDYTPTTEEIRAAYEGQLIKIGENRFELIDEGLAKAEFDRWLAEVKAKAWEEGYEQHDSDNYSGQPNSANPYRQGKEQ